MSWMGVITNAGNALLAQWAGGSETLYILGATAGSGYVSEVNMRTQTALQAEEDNASIIKNVVSGDNTRRMTVRIGPATGSAYTAHEVGIWAKLGASGLRTLLALHQDSGSGIDVPAASGSPEFAFDLICPIVVSNDGSLSVTIDPDVYASYEDIEEIESGARIAGRAKELLNEEPESETAEFFYRVTRGDADATISDARVISIKGKHTETGGVITQSFPTVFRSFGWNLFNPTNGSIRAVKYSNTRGFRITGPYSLIWHAEDTRGTNIQYITPDADGFFTIPGDGYITVSGGVSGNTVLWMTGDEWIEKPNRGIIEPYHIDSINFGTFMLAEFPNGLCEVGDVQDELNFDQGRAFRRIGRMDYSEANLATVQAMDVDYIYDATNIFYALAEEEEIAFDADGNYTAYSHGMEVFGGRNEVPPETEIEYRTNLKDMILENRERILDLQDETETQAADIAKGKRTLGIVEEGNTATQTISAGQYVVWKGKLYTADANISVGTTLAATGGSKNLTEKPSGGLNDLKSATDALNSKIGDKLTKITRCNITANDFTNFCLQVMEQSQINGECYVSGSWVGNDYFVATLQKIAEWTIIGMMAFGASNPKMYVLSRTADSTHIVQMQAVT